MRRRFSAATHAYLDETYGRRRSEPTAIERLAQLEGCYVRLLGRYRALTGRESFATSQWSVISIEHEIARRIQSAQVAIVRARRLAIEERLASYHLREADAAIAKTEGAIELAERLAAREPCNDCGERPCRCA